MQEALLSLMQNDQSSRATYFKHRKCCSLDLPQARINKVTIRPWAAGGLKPNWRANGLGFRDFFFAGDVRWYDYCVESHTFEDESPMRIISQPTSAPCFFRE